MTDAKYGCFNRPPFLPVVQSKQYGSTFPFTMNPNCQYTYTDLGRADPRCEGCKHKSPGLVVSQQETEGTQA